MTIPEPKFLLKDPKSTDPTLISMFLRFNNRRLVYSTGDKILPKLWDFDRQRAFNTKKNPESADINLWLDKIARVTKSVFRNLLIQGIDPSPKLLKKKLESRLNISPHSLKKDHDFFSFFQQFIDEKRAILSPSSIKTYKTTFNHLKAYSKRLDFIDIDQDFYHNYTNHLLNNIGLNKNSVGKHIQLLKAYLNEATRRGINSNLAFKNFKRLAQRVDTIYLNISELEKLSKLNLSYNRTWDRARDIFLIGAYTGLRFSDMSSLSKENLIHTVEGIFIRVITKKTDQALIIPIHPFIKEVIKKYGGDFPRPMSNQKLNEYIKEIGMLAGINEDIVITKRLNGVIKKNVVPKYTLITTHTARRSACTNMYLAGLPTISIMRLSGHKTERSFLKYIKISQEENANALASHSFFN